MTCKYCDCTKDIPGAKIAARIGGRINPIYVACYDEYDFLDGRYWMVERLSSTSRYERLVAINFCPVCGRRFPDNFSS